MDPFAINRILNIQQVNAVFKDEAAAEAQRRMAEIIADINIYNCILNRVTRLSLQYI